MDLERLATPGHAPWQCYHLNSRADPLPSSNRVGNGDSTISVVGNVANDDTHVRRVNGNHTLGLSTRDTGVTRDDKTKREKRIREKENGRDSRRQVRHRNRDHYCGGSRKSVATRRHYRRGVVEKSYRSLYFGRGDWLLSECACDIQILNLTTGANSNSVGNVWEFPQTINYEIRPICIPQ